MLPWSDTLIPLPRLLQEIDTRMEASRKERECGEHEDNYGVRSGV